MDWLNYHHLLYFWMVAREGSVARAAERLLLAQPTVSAQLQRLEAAVGHKLFKKVGRNLALTEMGHTVFRYADEIFAIGRELQDTLRGGPSGGARRLHVGIADVMPKLVAYKLLEPALLVDQSIHMVCLEGKPDRLLAELAVHAIDLVLCDSPAPPTVKVRSFNHLLGESTISVFGTPALAEKYAAGFPNSLQRAPFLLPTGNSAVRRSFDQWLTTRSLQIDIRVEFDDSALIKAFGQGGVGLFLGSSVIEQEICAQNSVQVLGRIPEVSERYYAVTIERKLKHPAVVAISEAARNRLFQGPGGISSSAKAAR
jgi:LysR family transcriptional activator of nhaA